MQNIRQPENQGLLKCLNRLKDTVPSKLFKLIISSNMELSSFKKTSFVLFKFKKLLHFLKQYITVIRHVYFNALIKSKNIKIIKIKNPIKVKFKREVIQKKGKTVRTGKRKSEQKIVYQEFNGIQFLFLCFLTIPKNLLNKVSPFCQ